MAFCFYHYPRSPLVISIYGIGFVLISIPIIEALPSDASLVAKVINFLALEFIAFAVIAGFFAITVVLSMVSRRNKTLLTEHAITLADGSFVEETAYNKTDCKWSGVQKLARTRSHIFIYIAQHMAHVIPRRVFRDNHEWDSFYEFCRQRTRAV